MKRRGVRSAACSDATTKKNDAAARLWRGGRCSDAAMTGTAFREFAAEWQPRIEAELERLLPEAERPDEPAREDERDDEEPERDAPDALREEPEREEPEALRDDEPLRDDDARDDDPRDEADFDEDPRPDDEPLRDEDERPELLVAIVLGIWLKDSRCVKKACRKCNSLITNA